MISKDRLDNITNLSVQMVNKLAFDCGYKTNFRWVSFVGINGDGHFVYVVCWDNGGCLDIDNVFIKYNHEDDTMSLEF